MKNALKQIRTAAFAALLTGCATFSPYYTSASATTKGLSQQTLYNLLVAEIAGRRHQLDIAAQHYHMAAEQTQDAIIAERATIIALYANNDDYALKAARIWHKENPQHPKANQILTEVYLRQEKPGKAYPYIKTLYEFTADKPDDKLSILCTQIVKSSKNPEGTLELLNRFTGKHQNPIRLNLAIASTAFLAQNYKTSDQHLDWVLKERPLWQTAVNLKAKSLFSQMKLEEALSFLKAKLKQMDDAPETRSLYARLLLEAQQITNAEEQFLILLEKDPKHIDALFAVALINIEQNRYPKAEIFFQRLKQLFPNNPNVEFYLGYIDEQQEYLTKAMKHYRYVTDGPNYFIAQLQVASILAKQGQIQQAREHLKTIDAENDTQSIQLIISEAKLLSTQDQYHTGINVINRGIDLYPNDINLLYTRAILSERIDQLEAMERDLVTILKQNPNHLQSLNALGFALADKTNRYDDALSYISRALKLAPNNPAVIDSMGWVQYKLGHYDAALYYLKQAYALSLDTEIAAHLGEVLWVSGQKDEAKRIWQKALDRSHDKSVIQGVMRRYISSQN